MNAARSETLAASLSQRLLGGALYGLVRLAVKPLFHPRVPVGLLRPGLWLATRLTLRARGSRIERCNLHGVPAERVRAGASGEGAVLYLHGGAYRAGTPRTHRSITSHLARATASTVYALDYRLAPEHAFPAALEDALSGYRWLLEQGHDPARVAVAGDSAGGGLSLALALRLRAEGLPLPAALVLFSPWVDLTLAAEQRPAVAGEAMLSPAGLAAAGRSYAGSQVGDPLVSPLYGDLAGLPPMLIQAGTREILLSDAQRLAERARAAGVATDLSVYADMWHVFQAHAGVLTMADAAIAEVACFLRQCRRAPAAAAAPDCAAPA